MCRLGKISMVVMHMARVTCPADCQPGILVQMKEAKAALAKEDRQGSVPPHAEPSQHGSEALSLQPETLHAASSAAQSSQMRPSSALAQPPSAAVVPQGHWQQPPPSAAVADLQPAPVRIQLGQPIIHLSRTAIPAAMPKSPSPPARAGQLGLTQGPSQPQSSAMATGALAPAGHSLLAQGGFTGIAEPVASQPAGCTQIELSQRSEAEHAADLQAAIDKAAREGADKNALLQSVGSVRKGTAKAIVNEVCHWRIFQSTAQCGGLRTAVCFATPPFLLSKGSLYRTCVSIDLSCCGAGADSRRPSGSNSARHHTEGKQSGAHRLFTMGGEPEQEEHHIAGVHPADLMQNRATEYH